MSVTGSRGDRRLEGHSGRLVGRPAVPAVRHRHRKSHRRRGLPDAQHLHAFGGCQTESLSVVQ